MDAPDITLNVLPEYKLELGFPNGSVALVDMTQRICGLRFGRLAAPGLFAQACLMGSEVVWDDGVVCIRASINELLDSMQMN